MKRRRLEGRREITLPAGWSMPARFCLRFLLLSTIALSGIRAVSIPSRGKQAGAIDAAGRIISLIRIYTTGEPSLNEGPGRLLGEPLDLFIDLKPAGESRFASFAEYASGRLRGARLSKRIPEEASRALFALAQEAEGMPGRAGAAASSGANQEQEANRATRKAWALFARYHARKILAGTYLSLFYRSGDASALRVAISQTAAGIEIWDQLRPIVQQAGFPRDLFGQASDTSWQESLALVRQDLERLNAVQQALDRYGLFNLGLDFGSTIAPGHGLANPSYANSYSSGCRFSPLGPETTYSAARGYGWSDCAGISASEPSSVLSPGRGRYPGLPLPAGALYRSFLRGRAKSTLLVDLPDGDYQVTTVVANQPELAAGSFQIRAAAAGDIPARLITYTEGESGDKSMVARVEGGRMALEFIPEPGKNWIVNRMVLTLCAPHIGHVPVFAATPGSGFILTPTITAPDGIRAADLHLTAKHRTTTIPLLPDGSGFTCYIAWAPAWNGSEAAYYITAQDKAGHVTRWPPAGAVTVRIHQ